MGKLQNFEIIFEPSQGVFFADTVVQGHVRLELKEPLKMRGLFVSYYTNAWCFVWLS